MPQPTRNWYFEAWPDGEAGGPAEADGHDGHDDRDDGPAGGLAGLPPALLARHGGLVLDPGGAAAIPHRPGAPAGWSGAPGSTVYRARTLLVPGDLLADPVTVGAANAALARVGMRLVPPGPGRRVRGGGRVAELLRRLPRVAVLVPAAEPGRPALPVRVDAWTALQALRAAAGPGDQAGPGGKGGGGDQAGPGGDGGAAGPDAAHAGAALTMAAVSRIALEHLLVGSAITGAPSTEGNGISGSPSTEGNGLTGPGSTDSYAYRGGDTRSPITLCLPAPARRRLAECGSRRPVVAVLDTGVRAHPWLDVRPDPALRYVTGPGDGFTEVDWDIQHAVLAESESAAARGDSPRVPVGEPWDTPVTGAPLLGELNDATGHGSFIAGIVRQAAPDARVLAIRIMHSDGVVYEGDLLEALAQLADRIAAAGSGDMARMVDVVSLSLGYFDESPADLRYSSGLWQVIEVLLEMGVAVVAAAGNFATSRRFYPAAFALRTPRARVPVVSVGALNPNGSKALFSDDGRWVRAWAAGAAVVSAFPDDVNGSRAPQVRERPHGAMPPGHGPHADREALDPDDYRGGFAVWSGTSFSAPLIAALIAARLLAGAADPALALDRPGAQAATDRTAAALASLRARPGARERA